MTNATPESAIDDEFVNRLFGSSHATPTPIPAITNDTESTAPRASQMGAVSPVGSLIPSEEREFLAHLFGHDYT